MHGLAWFTVLWLGVLTTLSAQPVLRIDPSFQESFLGGYLARFDSPQAVPACSLPLQFNEFSPVAESVVNYGSDDRHHYLRLHLQNTGLSPRRLVLNLQQHFFEEADLFIYLHPKQPVVSQPATQ